MSDDQSTPRPWVYRPRAHDDWGWIRGAGEGLPYGDLACIARGDDSSKSHDDHRRDKTDPYAANAALIVRAVNSIDRIDALVKALEEIEDLGANGATAARLGNIAHAALLAFKIGGRS